VKKLLASILVGCMLFSVVTVSGCGKKDEKKDEKKEEKKEEKKS
jgi:hypothetical protein